MCAAFIGAFVGGFAAGFLNIGIAGLLSLPLILGVAYLVGRWVARRKDAPNEYEIVVGCCVYVLLCILLAIGARRHVAVLLAMVAGCAVAGLFYKGASNALRSPVTQDQSALGQTPTPSDPEPPSSPTPESVKRDPNWAVKSALGFAVILAAGLALFVVSWMHPIRPAVTPPTEISPAQAGTQSMKQFDPLPATASSSIPDQTSASSHAHAGETYDPTNSSPGSTSPTEAARLVPVNPNQHMVEGYTRADGRYVAPYIATDPNHDRTDNFSTKGTTNPYTGARGHH